MRQPKKEVSILIKTHLFDFSTVDDIDDIIDGDACFSYVSGQDLRKKKGCSTVKLSPSVSSTMIRIYMIMKKENVKPPP